MNQLFERFLRDERGEDLIEYALLVAFAAAVVTAAILTDPVGMKTAITGAFSRARTALAAP